MATLKLTEGWTSPIEYQLKTTDPANPTDPGTPIDGADKTVDLILKDKSGAAVEVVGDVEWAEIAVGKVRYNPDATDLTASGSPFTARFRVRDASGKDSFFPQGEPEIWKVFAQ